MFEQKPSDRKRVDTFYIVKNFKDKSIFTLHILFIHALVLLNFLLKMWNSLFNINALYKRKKNAVYVAWIDSTLWLNMCRKWSFATVKLSFLFNIENNNVLSLKSHLSKKWSSISLQWAATFKLIQYCCALTRRADAYWWNIQVAKITIDCIYIRQGIRMLA